MIRKATLDDIDRVQKVFAKNQKFVGFVMKASLEEAVLRDCLLVYENEVGDIVGAVNFRPTKRGYLTIYEIATIEHGRGAGKALIEALKRFRMNIRLKVTEDNENAHKFYEKVGFKLIGTEAGRKRPLRVYLWDSGAQKKLF